MTAAKSKKVSFEWKTPAGVTAMIALAATVGAISLMYFRTEEVPALKQAIIDVQKLAVSVQARTDISDANTTRRLDDLDKSIDALREQNTNILTGIGRLEGRLEDGPGNKSNR